MREILDFQAIEGRLWGLIVSFWFAYWFVVYGLFSFGPWPPAQEIERHGSDVGVDVISLQFTGLQAMIWSSGAVGLELCVFGSRA